MRLSDHAVLVGFGLAGQNVARVLRSLEIPYVAIEANATAVQEAQRQGEDVVFGDATRAVLLRRVGISRAKLVCVAITDPTATRPDRDPRPLAQSRRHDPGAHPLRPGRGSTSLAGANVVVAEELEGTIDLVSETLRIFGIAEGAIDRFTAELREEGYEMLRTPAALALDPWLTELLEQVSTEWLEVPEGFEGEASLADLEFRSRTGASVLAVDRGGTTSSNPQPSFPIRAGDRLLVFGGTEKVARARDLLGVGADQ